MRAQCVTPGFLLLLSTLATAAPLTDVRGHAVETASNELRLASQRITLDFEEAPLVDVMRYMREVTGANIVVTPAVFADRSEDDLLVTLAVSDLRADRALSLIADLLELSYQLKHGVILVTTEESKEEEMILNIYPVHDITRPIQDFPGPNIELNQEGDPGINVYLPDDDDREPTLDDDSLVDIIQENIQPESWDEEGRSIRVSSNKLIVVQSQAVHEEIRKLLQVLR